jgi:hypothetical protein
MLPIQQRAKQQLRLPDLRIACWWSRDRDAILLNAIVSELPFLL